MSMQPTRRFEDLQVGERRRSSDRRITQDEIVDFARQYDPQWFHTDVEAAKASVFGEVVASGVHVLAIWRQLDHTINADIDFVCGVGWDEVRMKRALKAGDTVHVTSEIIALRPSATKPERGTALTRYAMVNQTGDEIISFTSINLVYTRAAERG